MLVIPSFDSPFINQTKSSAKRIQEFVESTKAKKTGSTKYLKQVGWAGA